MARFPGLRPAVYLALPRHHHGPVDAGQEVRILEEVLIATEPVLDWPASSPYRQDICRDVLRSLRQRRRVVMASPARA
jgi:hypothetical protein